MKRAPKRVVLVRWLIGAVVAVGLYALAGFVVLPQLAGRCLPDESRQRFGVSASVDSIRFDPFRLRLQANDVRLGLPGAEPVLVAERLLVDLEWSSLWRRAWTLAEVLIEGLEVDAEIAEDGRLDLATLAERFASDRSRPEPDRAEPRVVLRHARLVGARLALTDRRGAQAAHAALERIEAEVFDVGSGPSRNGRYALTATLPEGGSLAARGTVSLRPLGSAGEISVSGFRAATAWAFYRDRLGIDEPVAKLSASTRYEFAAGDSPTVRLQQLAVHATGIALASRGAGSPGLTLEAIDVTQGRFDLSRRELVLPVVALRGGVLSVAVEPDGSLALRRLAGPPTQTGASASASAAIAVPTPAVTAQAQAPSPAGSSWRAEIGSLRIDALTLHLADQSRPTPLRLDVGAASLQTRLAIVADAKRTSVAADALGARFERIALTEAAATDPLVSLGSVALVDARLSTGSKRIEAGRIAVRGGQAALTRTEVGTIDLLETLGIASNRSGTPPPSAGKAEGADPPWRYALGALEVENVELALADRSGQPAVEYGVEVASATLRDLGNASESPMRLDARLRVKQGGTIDVAGTIAPDGASAEAQIGVDRLALGPLDALLARHAALDLKSGTLSAAARARYRTDAAGPSVQASGTLSIADLLVAEAGSGDRLLAWKTMAATGVSFASDTNRLEIEQTVLTEPGAKLVISKDRRLELATLFESRRPEARGRAEAPAVRSDRPKLDVRIDRIRLRDGEVDYADLSLVLPFSTRVSNVDGTILNLSTAPSRQAQVKASGEIPPYGSASVDGALLPSDPTRFLDLRVAFANVAIAPLSPYTATFAGRKVDSGRLWLNLDYKIADDQLLGRNRIRLADFKLGERVKAPGAWDLPLDLAVALLSDTEGRINLAVPVTGSLGDPSFDLGTLVREALGNVLQRIVSAPFRALGALFGGEAEGDGRATRIRFVPGSAELAPRDREKLDKLAEALKQRPQLTLVVEGPYAPARDREALRAERVRQELAAALGDALAAGEDPGPIAYGDAKTQLALRRLLDKHAGENAAETFETQYRQQARTAAAGTGSPPAASDDANAGAAVGEAPYRAMFQQIVQHYPMSDEDVQLLAARRAQRIVEYLVGSAGADAKRVQPGRIRSVDDRSGSAVAATLELGTVEARARAGA